MPNVLGNFNVPLYATAALDILMNSLSTPRRVNRRYEEERKAFGRGEVVNIRRPSTFQVYDAPIAAGAVDDLKTGTVALSLDYYKETKFKVTDRDLTVSTDAIIKEHIAPMAYAHKNAIETNLLTLSALFPHCIQQSAAAISTPALLTQADKIMRENGVPDDGPSRRHYAASPTVWEKWLGLQAFTNWQGAGAAGVNAQETASIGQKFGFSPYATNNGLSVSAQTSPTITTGVTNGTFSKGATTVNVDAATLTGTFKRGMVVQIGTTSSTAGDAYNRELYAITADVTASGNAAALQISPPLRADVADGVTFTLKANAAAAAYKTDFAFHENALALVMAPLPSMAMGADVQTVTDDATGISIRLRLFYDGNASAHYCAMDVLYAQGVLDADMGVRGIIAA
jgi:hypothetical protein